LKENPLNGHPSAKTMVRH